MRENECQDMAEEGQNYCYSVQGWASVTQCYCSRDRRREEREGRGGGREEATGSHPGVGTCAAHPRTSKVTGEAGRRGEGSRPTEQRGSGQGAAAAT